MDCKTFRQAIYRFADDELEQEVVISFVEHLDHCPDCEIEVTYVRRLLRVVRRCPRATAPLELRRRILTSFPHRQWEER